MHPDRDFDWRSPLPPQADDLVRDLGLDILIGAMAGDDGLLREVALHGLLCGLDDGDEIVYRQLALGDAVQHPDVIHGLHDLAAATLVEEKRIWGWFTTSPELNLGHATRVMELLLGRLRALRQVAAENAGRFTSPAFRRLFAMLLEELDDAYLAQIEEHLERLRFRRGVVLGAGLGPGGAGTGYVLLPPLGSRGRWLDRVWDRGDPRLRFELDPRDDGGHQALSELRIRGINLVADALARSCEHVLGFFTQLRAELAFYIGCLQLGEALERRGHATSMPLPRPRTEVLLETTGLYDAVLALTLEGGVVSNDVSASDRPLLLVTGANRGGKSTFLRSLGIAQLMMQAGMPAPAAAFSSAITSGVFTHFMREEDATMTRGRLDEELERMRRVIDLIRPGALLLCNESFASTNEREAADIGEEVFGALIDAGARVALVTHLYELARRFAAGRPDATLSLRAERLPDGSRTFRVREGAALPTSFGRDVYEEVFSDSRGAPRGTERGPAAPASGGV